MGHLNKNLEDSTSKSIWTMEALVKMFNRSIDPVSHWSTDYFCDILSKHVAAFWLCF